MKNWLKYLFDFFIFTSLFITVCALFMIYQTQQLLHLPNNLSDYYWFVLFSTICSYNFHWYLTPDSTSEMIRMRWTRENKKLHLFLFGVGLVGAAWYFFQIWQHWFWLGGGVVLTFLYSAPKLAYKPFTWLRKIAVGKTIFLAFVWMYVTTFLPIVISSDEWRWDDTLFCISRFFLIYAICIPFDYRDRDYDQKEGIKSMITWFDERGVDRLFYCSLFVFAMSTVALYWWGFSWPTIALILSPGLILVFLYPVAKRNFSDYLYYFILDGLMMFSALCTSFLSI